MFVAALQEAENQIGCSRLSQPHDGGTQFSEGSDEQSRVCEIPVSVYRLEETPVPIPHRAWLAAQHDVATPGDRHVADGAAGGAEPDAAVPGRRYRPAARAAAGSRREYSR